MNFRNDFTNTLHRLGIVYASTLQPVEKQFVMQIERFTDTTYSRKWFYLDNPNQRYYTEHPEKVGVFQEDLEDYEKTGIIRTILSTGNKKLLFQLNRYKIEGVVMESETLEMPKDEF